MFFKHGNSRTDSISDSVYRDIIAILYDSLVPVVLTALAQLIVGCIAAWQTGDVLIWVLTVAGVLLAIGRSVDVLAFRRRIAQRPPLERAEAVRWEWRYAAGSIATAVLIGAFAARCVLLGDAACSAMATGLAFGFGAGVVARLSLRPVVAILDLGFAGLPVIVATFLQELDAPHIGLGVLFAIYLAGSFEMVRLSYNANVGHITLKREFEHMARRDPMTGLFNRAALAADLNQLILERGVRMVAVHSIDLDHFKAANDRFGHPFGDALLRQVADRLRAIAAAGDLLVRMGGDEFILVQKSISSRDNAEAMAKRIYQIVSAPYCIDGQDIVIGVSIGVAIAPEDGVSVEALLSRSDRALYKAKEFRGGYVFASDLGSHSVGVSPSESGQRQDAA